MQNTIIKEFENDPDVVTAVLNQAGLHGETLSWTQIFWKNNFLRENLLFDENGAIGEIYDQPYTGLPFGRGFIINQNGGIALPFFGHNPQMVIDKIYALLDDGIIYGDVDGNDEIQAYDAALTLQYSAGLTEFEEWQIIAADVDGDGSVLAFDAALILQYSAGIINEFPISSR